jgi:hypothetical protein
MVARAKQKFPKLNQKTFGNLVGFTKDSHFWCLKLSRFSSPWFQQGDNVGCVYIVESYSNVGGKKTRLMVARAEPKTPKLKQKNIWQPCPIHKRFTFFGVLNFSGLALLGCNKETL